MSVQLIEGFEGLKKEGIIRDPSGNSAIRMDNTAGFWSRGAYNTGVSAEHMLLKTNTEDHFFGAWRFYPGNFGVNIFSIVSQSNQAMFTISVTGDGHVQVQDANNNGQGTSTNVLTQSAWNLIEFEVTLGSSGAAKVWLHGLATADIDISGKDFQYGSDTNGWGIRLWNNTGNIWDDIIIYDDTGTKWNSRVGDKVVKGLLLNAQGDQENWNPPVASASRWYFPTYVTADQLPTTAPDGYQGYSPSVSPTPAAEWDVTNYDNGFPFLRGMLSPYRQGTQIHVPSHNRPSPDATNGQDVLMGQFISPAIAAQTITGTLKMQMQVNEENTSQDQRSQVIVRVVSADGNTVRGTLYAGDTGSMTDEWSTSRQNTTFPQDAISPVTMSSVTAQDGDRIVVEYGWRTHATGQGNGDSREVLGDGGSSGDLPDSEADTTTATTYNPWIQFSNAITLLDNTNWEFLDDAPADEDYTYVETSTDNDLDLYNIEAVPGTLTVNGPVVIKTRAKKTDPGVRTLTHALKTSGSTQSSSALPLQTSYAYQRSYYDTDPTDSADWSDSKVNGLQVGIKATT